MFVETYVSFPFQRAVYSEFVLLSLGGFLVFTR